jgi:hypothetical protein
MWVTVFTARSGEAKALAKATSTKTEERHMGADPQEGQKHTSHLGLMGTHRTLEGVFLRVLILLRKSNSSETGGV